jgi:electron transfer flavoprotein alpha subunit
MSTNVLAFAELRDGVLRPAAAEAVAAARGLADELGGSVDAVAIGPPGTSEAVVALGSAGADRAFVAEDESFRNYHPDAALRALEQVAAAGHYAAVVFSASMQGKDLAPRAAVRLDAPLATDVTKIAVDSGVITASRPVYAGKAMADVRFDGAPALLSVRPNVFMPGQRDTTTQVESIDVAATPTRQVVSGIESAARESLDVSEATIVVAGGRGLQGPDKWGIIEDLVDALGPDATIGASRAVVDAGWRPHSEQVGQTGKVVSPSLYFAIGISGAIQHLAGMRTAKVIVAVNKDPDAPIFSIADYGIVGDLFEVVPLMAEEIRKARSSG